MKTLFEQSDYLTSPFEAFTFDSVIGPYPVTSHWHYFCEILYVTDGSAFILCDTKQYKVVPGDFVFFHPQSIHSIFGEDHFVSYVMKFDISLLKSTGSHMDSFQKIFLQAQSKENMDKKAPIILKDSMFDNFDLTRVFQTCIRELNEMKYGYDLCVQAELTNLLTQVLRIWRNLGFETDMANNATSINSTNLNTTNTTANPFPSVIEYIDANLSQSIKVEDLAQMSNMSYSYFAKQFRTIYGRSCKEYISFMRVNRAKDLLLFTNYDLNYICQETGFADCSHLIRTFKKIENTTPKQYRLNQGVFSK